ncbi:helix-turn-helix transcriptional regulator [Shewanella corallii]|uniref:Helix-turn-helix transcriptional regulator n=1 Tax=Shewanella corallii TaxID=560080 RepID=A0ABT0N4W3_9GAMM|nr:helix-turn-helix transcriptional regulator [Shewanella corallii]
MLSGREVSVIELVRQGHRNKQIALELDISEQTVKFHLKNIFRKLGVKGRRQAVAVLSAGLPNFQ